MDLFRMACGLDKQRVSIKSLCKRTRVLCELDKLKQEKNVNMLGCKERGYYWLEMNELDKLDLRDQLALLQCINRRGFAYIIEPTIPDFGASYEENWTTWIQNPTLVNAPYGSMILLRKLRIFKNPWMAKRVHHKLLQKHDYGTAVNKGNVCMAPPVLSLRTNTLPLSNKRYEKPSWA